MVIQAALPRNIKDSFQFMNANIDKKPASNNAMHEFMAHHESKVAIANSEVSGNTTEDEILYHDAEGDPDTDNGRYDHQAPVSGGGSSSKAADSMAYMAPGVTHAPNHPPNGGNQQHPTSALTADQHKVSTACGGQNAAYLPYDHASLPAAAAARESHRMPTHGSSNATTRPRPPFGYHLDGLEGNGWPMGASSGQNGAMNYNGAGSKMNYGGYGIKDESTSFYVEDDLPSAPVLPSNAPISGRASSGSSKPAKTTMNTIPKTPAGRMPPGILKPNGSGSRPFGVLGAVPILPSSTPTKPTATPHSTASVRFEEPLDGNKETREKIRKMEKELQKTEAMRVAAESVARESRIQYDKLEREMKKLEEDRQKCKQQVELLEQEINHRINMAKKTLTKADIQ